MRLTMPITADSAVVHVTHKDSCLPLLTCAPLHPAVKVVTFLTMPIAADSDSAPTQALYMQQVKEAFLAQDAMTVIVGLVAEPLGRWERQLELSSHLCPGSTQGWLMRDLCRCEVQHSYWVTSLSEDLVGWWQSPWAGGKGGRIC